MAVKMSQTFAMFVVGVVTAFAVCQQLIPFLIEPCSSRHLPYTRVNRHKQTTPLSRICKLDRLCTTEEEINTVSE